MPQNLDDLRVFLRIADTGSFTAAAAQLGVSQSALSYTVRQLEERLKIKLLDRTTRSVSTTAAGEASPAELLAAGFSTPIAAACCPLSAGAAGAGAELPPTARSAICMTAAAPSAS